MEFSYSDPEAGFDRSKVQGLVASLVELDEKNHKFSTALEVCAGGRLYNVVVEDEKVGSKLLANGKLKKRVTLIPLNKINAFVASAQVRRLSNYLSRCKDSAGTDSCLVFQKIASAQKLAPGKVDLALSLVGYEDQVSAAMEYVFGNTLICADAESAKRVTFDAAVRMKSVTLDGDVYDPAGTLSGGSKPSTGGVLVKMQELGRVEKELAAARQALNECEAAAKDAQDEMAQFAKVKREMDLKTHEVSLLEGQVNGSNATRVSATRWMLVAQTNSKFTVIRRSLNRS